MQEVPTTKTKGVSFTTRLANANFYTAGYSTNIHWLGLNSPEKYAFYHLVDKPMLGFKYTYEGIITGSAFQSHHMVDSDDERADLLLATKPVTPYHVIIYYEDGTSAAFEFLSTSTSTRLGGGFKIKQLNEFDGILWMTVDPHTKTYFVNGPYNR
ncbi:hypothetical protein [Proteus sp. ZN5]|uniref:hypothetical protein n=1 Tax=Proteus sp. ZN5 TaxID=2697019 RepID=UPI0013E17E50|nr:hypothetical protein [Proteus sp. ZN5]QIG05413.1 hypothetical protein GTK47_08715 [Proteus sp. ZN5]